MRLYDALLAARDTAIDEAYLWGFTALGKSLEQAECFVMSGDVTTACAEVCQAKPSTILSAIHLIRAPYPFTWVEWQMAERPLLRHVDKPTPTRVGCLLITGPDCDQGYAIIAWQHRDGSTMFCPLCLTFNWSADGISPLIKYAQAVGHGVEEAKATLARLNQWQETAPLPDKWARHTHDPDERKAALILERRAHMVPVEFCLPWLVANNVHPGTAAFDSFVDDLAGELPYVEAFLLLLNSRNSIIGQQRDDFSRLNKARAKRRKPPIKEFITTRLKLSKVQYNRALASGHTRATAHLHLVRGHFKVRKSGVYWWSPHARGQGSRAKRAGYDVI